MKYLLSIVFIFSLFYSDAQIGQPELGWVFEDSSVSRIDIVIDQDSLDEMLLEENWYNDHEYPATMYFERDGLIDTVLNVGFRLRGNTSRNAGKKSFKIAINSFIEGERYYGLKKINLNGEHNDPSISRSKLNWDLLADNTLPSTRVAHTEFYINDVYKGLYINVEHINDDFLKLRYDNDNGNLYKCLWPANLQYISSNPEDYKLESGGRRVYELKTNIIEDDYSDIANFIDILNNTPVNNLYCELSMVFDVEDFLEILAIDVMTGNWDGYSFNKNNFYLYHNIQTDRLQFINYDLDNTLGIDWFGVDWTQRNIYSWSPSWDDLPLYERVMANDEMKGIFSFFIDQIINQMNEDAFEGDIDLLRDLIAPFAATDTFRILDYGFSYDEFWDCFDEDIPYDHVDSGIIPFYENRVSSAENQLDLQDIPPIIRYIQVEPKLTALPISVKAFVEDEAIPTEVWAIYSYGGVEDSTLLYDDGLHGDGEALDGWYANVIGTFTDVGFLDLQIRANDVAEQSRILPCEALQYLLEPGSPLVINEFMAKNDSTIQDNAGNYSDWVEIYNNSGEDLSMDGFFLSDDLNNATKWAFPAISISPSGFYLVWCSADTTLGDNHSNFKLSASGEEVGLFQIIDSDTLLVDGLSFGVQTPDTSYGRETDAHPNWVFFPYPTPNSSNGVIPVGVDEIIYSNQIISVYPNPFVDQTSIFNHFEEEMSVDVYSISGQLLISFEIASGERFEYKDENGNGIRIIKWQVDKKRGVVRVVKI